MGYPLLAYVHLLAAATWLGGTLFLALVLVPVTRSAPGPPGVGVAVLRAAARRFRTVAWAAALVLIVTGAWLYLQRSGSVAGFFTGEGDFVQVLRVKAALAAAVIVLSATHDFVLGPRLAREMEAVQRGSPPPARVARQRRAVTWLARVNLLLLLAIAALGAVLVRGVAS